MKTCREKGFNVFNGDVSDYNSKDKFDLIIAVGVFEHIAKPLDWLQSLKSFLNYNGKIIIQFPNIDSLNKKISNISKHDWDMFLEPGHLYLFDHDNLNALSKKIGLKIYEKFTSTILIRGKIPFMPIRSVYLERKVQRMCRNKTFMNIYKLLLRSLDKFSGGDTVTYVLGRV